MAAMHRSSRGESASESPPQLPRARARRRADRPTAPPLPARGRSFRGGSPPPPAAARLHFSRNETRG
jgi:hypothetical protein